MRSPIDRLDQAEKYKATKQIFLLENGLETACCQVVRNVADLASQVLTFYHRKGFVGRNCISVVSIEKLFTTATCGLV